MTYVARQVPITAREQRQADQQPVFQLSGGSWPVASLLGGKGLTKGLEPPDPLVSPAAAARAAGPVINTGGGAYVGGNVNVGGEFIGRDKNVYGDEVHGDKLTVGNVAGMGIAIGRGAQANVQQGISAAELEPIFAPLVSLTSSLPPDRRAPAEQKVEELKQEVAKGKAADDNVMGRLIQGLVNLVPGAVGAVVSMFATPVLGGVAGPVTRFVLDRIQGK